MLHFQKYLPGPSYRNTFRCAVLAIASMVVTPLLASHPAVAVPSQNHYVASAGEGNNIYLVIGPDVTKEILDRSVAKLKEQGITMRYANAAYKEGRLAAIEITIEVPVQGKQNDSYTLKEDSNDNSFTPLVFYYEMDGQRVGFVKETPADMSREGRLLTSNNLVGVAILNGNSMELAGKAAKTWE